MAGRVMAGVIVRAKTGQDMVRTVEDIARAAEDMVRSADDNVRTAEARHSPVEPDHDEKSVAFGADIVPLARDPATTRRAMPNTTGLTRGTHGSDQVMDCMVWRQ
jgi:hypothetical protein